MFLSWQKGFLQSDSMNDHVVEGNPGLSGCSRCNHNNPHKGKREAGKRREWCGAASQGMLASLEAGKGKGNGLSSRDSRRNTTLLIILILVK